MSELLNERWSRFLDGELPEAEQQWLLEEISHGERLSHDPVSDAETQGMLAVLSRVAGEDDDAFTNVVMARIEQASINDTQTTAATKAFFPAKSVSSEAPAATSLSKSDSGPDEASADQFRPKDAAKLRNGTSRLRTKSIAAIAAALAGMMLAVAWIALPQRNAVQVPDHKNSESVPAPKKQPATLPQKASDSETPSPKSPAVVPDETQLPLNDDPPATPSKPSNQGLAQQPTDATAPETPETPRRQAYPQPAPIWTIKNVPSQLVKWGSPLPRDIEGKTLQLLEGSAELVCGDVGEMTIHAPAEFRAQDSSLFLKYGRVMARAQAPLKIDTPSTGIEIIDRANVVSDTDGTGITAIGPVGLFADKDKANAKPVVVPPGQFKWVAKTGQIYDWMVGMLEAEGVMTLLVNGELFRLSTFSAVNPSPHVQEYLLLQVRSLPTPGDFRGVLFINGKSYTYEGTRGISSAGRRLTSQLQQRRKAAIASGVGFNINGIDLGGVQARVGAGQIHVAPAAPSTATAKQAADELLNRQQQMIQSMQQAFGVDLSNAQRAVQQARQRVHQALPEAK